MPPNPAPRRDSDRDTVQQVKELARLLDEAGLGAQRTAAEAFSTGVGPLDHLLPRRGFARGSLVEWLADPPGAGAALLALSAAREAQREGGAVVVVDRDQGFYPPAAAAWRLDLASLIVVHPQSEADERWALDQSLRCEHVAAVLAWPRRLDDVAFRRLQLAAEASGAVGLLVRPAAAEREPSWADVRLLVVPRPAATGGWRLNLRILRCRGSTLVSRDAAAECAHELLLEINDTTGDIHEAHPRHLAAGLAHPTPPKQQA